MGGTAFRRIIILVLLGGAVMLVGAIAIMRFSNIDIGLLPTNRAAIFAAANLPELDALVKTDVAEHSHFQDTIISAKGTYDVANEDRIIRYLKSKGFEAVDNMMSSGGNADYESQISGQVVSKMDYYGLQPHVEQRLRLLHLRSGETIFLFDYSTD